jgi:hypothetical protein
MKHLYSAIKTMADSALWLGVVSAFFASYVSLSNMLPVVVLAGVSCGLASLLSTKNKSLRFVSGVIILASLIFCHSVYDLILAVPVIIYVTFIIVKEMFTAEYVIINDIFPKAAIVVALAALFHAYIGLSWGFICAVIYVGCSVFLLRVLRHDEENSGSKKLAFLELIVLFAVFVMCVFFSSNAFMSVAGAVGGLVYDYVLTPIMSLFSLLIYGFFWVILKIGSLFIHETTDFDMTTVGSQISGLSDDVMENVKTQNGNAHMAIIVLKIVGVIVFIGLAILFFRWLLETMSSRKTGRSVSGGLNVYDEDRPIENDKPKFSDHSPSAKVRRYYLSYLQAATSAGVEIAISDTSRDVNVSSERFTDKDLADELRGYYIRARYKTENDLTQSEVKRAHAISKQLKFQLKKRGLQ